MSLLKPFKKKYRPLNTIEISSENLKSNYRYFSQMSGLKISPVLKSNAYGHGIVEVGKTLDSLNAPFFCVDSIYEAYQLLKNGVHTQIVIMGYVHPESLGVKELHFSFAVYTKEMLLAIKKHQPHAGIHIFVDTGMHREGVFIDELPHFLRLVTKYNLKVEGLMSHFAMADKPNNPDTIRQVKNFIKAQEIVSGFGIKPEYVHIAATSGVMHANDFRVVRPHPNPLLKGEGDQRRISLLGNMGRVGIGLYGIDPEGKNTKLKPVLTVKSTIIQIKNISKNEKIGYDFTFTAKKDMKVAIVPMGYNDGVKKELSNKGFMKVNKIFCPIVGQVSMNITVIDVTHVKNAKVGSEVIVYSSNSKDKNSIINAAKICKVIPYEILIGLHPSTKRLII